MNAVIAARDASSLDRPCEAHLGRAVEGRVSALSHVDLVRLRAVRDACAALRTATNSYLAAALAVHLALATLARKEQS